MGSTVAKWGMLLGGAAIAFGVTVAVGLKLLPAPHSDTDYLVVGSVATFVCLGVVFGMLITTWVRSPNVFFKTRARAEGDAPSDAPAPPEA